MSETENIKRLDSSEEARQKRVESLRKLTGDPLLSLSFSGLDSVSTSGNIENYIGTLQIPVGIAGPLSFNFKAGAEAISAPIATTEGALVSSISRGALAISASGGVNTKVISNRMIRAPHFEFSSLETAWEFSQWVQSHFEDLQKLVQKKSRFAKLIEMDCKIFGKVVQIRFIYTTGDAAGQNMTTFCTAQLCDWILKTLRLETTLTCVDFFIEGNLSSDKKVSSITAIEGRGRSVMAEATIKASVLKKVLKVTAFELVQQVNRCKSNRIYSGMYGFNINVANAVAGLFLSTGQDMACVHECSIAELHVETKGEDLYACLYLPSLIVGTVGGGVHLPGPRDSLKILGCSGEGKADRLAEIIAGYALALELSTVSAISGGQFVGAHERYARETTQNWLKQSDLNPDFFNEHLIKTPNQIIKNIQPITEIDIENGHVSDLAFQVSKKFCGLMAFELETENTIHNKTENMQVFLKIKPRDSEVIQGAARILSSVSPDVSALMVSLKHHLPFYFCHEREIQAAKLLKNFDTKLMPHYLGSFEDSKKEAFVLLQELIGKDYLISPVNNVEIWTEENINLVFDKIARLHAAYLSLSQEEAQMHVPHLYSLNLEARNEIFKLWEKLYSVSMSLITHNNREDLARIWESSLKNYLNHFETEKSLPQTLIHYDFNTRNIALNPGNDALFFDWEFMSWGLPQRDILEFLIFSLDLQKSPEQFKQMSDLYLIKLNSLSQQKISTAQWNAGLQIAFEDFVVGRLSFYVIISQFSRCEYLDRVIQNVISLKKGLL